jgi:hypothetical protein
MNFLDKLQQAWQSQCSKPIDVKPDQLLNVARHERRVLFGVDMFVISVFLCVGVYMLWSAFRDIQKDWPWLISAACDAWVVGYILFDRWRRRRDAAHYDETLLAHVEGAIKELENQRWLSRNTLWWYILPIALGCMIPPVLFFAMDYSKNPGLGPRFALLFGLLFTLGVFAVTLIFVYLVMKYAARIGLEKRRQQLQALRTLRATLLNDEPGN